MPFVTTSLACFKQKRRELKSNSKGGGAHSKAEQFSCHHELTREAQRFAGLISEADDLYWQLCRVAGWASELPSISHPGWVMKWFFHPLPPNGGWAVWFCLLG